MLETAVDRLHGTVGDTDIELGEDLVSSVPEAAAELGQLLEPLRDTGAESFEALEYRELPCPAVGVAVGIDEFVVAPGCDLDRGMSVVGRQRGVELRFLLVGE
ncbi:hypothetical protein [Rhodococcus sp. ABRD24]|uniref:hypothetical protein n=1 Tax=Rhodococcus sp. ABRD24 TaxID=2507582 RepID=UPI00325B71C8